MDLSNPLVGAVAASDNRDHSKHKSKKSGKDKKKKKHHHKHHKHEKHKKHDRHSHGEEEMEDENEPLRRPIAPIVATNNNVEMSGTHMTLETNSKIVHPGTFEAPNVENIVGSFSLGSTKVQPESNNSNALKADDAGLEPTAMAQMKSENRIQVGSPKKPRYQIRPDTQDDLEKLALAYDNNKDGIFSFLEVKQIATRYVHDLKLGKLATNTKGVKGGNCPPLTIAALFTVATIVGVGVAVLGTYLGLLSTAGPVGIPRVFDTPTTHDGTLGTPVFNAAQIATKTAEFVSLRGPYGTQVSVTETKEILITEFSHLFEANHAALSRMTDISFVVQNSATPLSGFTYISDRILGYRIVRSQSELELILSSGTIRVERTSTSSGVTAEYSQVVEGNLVSSPIHFPQHDTLIATNLEVPTSSLNVVGDGAQCPFGMIAPQFAEATLEDCQCPHGTFGNIWTGCHSKVTNNEATRRQQCSSRNTKLLSSSLLCEDHFTSTRSSEWFSSIEGTCATTFLRGTENIATCERSSNTTDTFDTMASKCIAQGARLCTQSELLKQTLIGSHGTSGKCDLSHSQELVWSSTPCEGGGYWGVAGDGSKSTCLTTTSDLANGACCADITPRCTAPDCVTEERAENSTVAIAPLEGVGECQLPFVYQNQDGTTTTYSSCPTIGEAKPADADRFGIASDTRWCPVQGSLLGNRYSAASNLAPYNNNWGICKDICHTHHDHVLERAVEKAGSETLAAVLPSMSHVPRRCLPSATLSQARQFCNLMQAKLCDESELRNLSTLFQSTGTPNTVHGNTMADLRCASDSLESGVANGDIITSTECGGGNSGYYVVLTLASDGKSFTRTCVQFTEMVRRGVTCCAVENDFTDIKGGIMFNMAVFD